MTTEAKRRQVEYWQGRETDPDIPESVRRLNTPTPPAEAAVLHAIMRDHKWTPHCLDCAKLTVLHDHLGKAHEAKSVLSEEVGRADRAHADEPEPRGPNEGWYPRGKRDGFAYLLDLE